jgi:hypothetical protein|tara:strand:+ start:1632 stop:1859 length:228 start_codon:yes stop_codon:yes gene_type:complete
MRQDKKLQLLETLHTVLIENLLDKVKSGEAKAGDLNVARQLLKDNGIECIPTEKSPMEDLMSNLPDLDVIPSIER